jgi:integrase
MDVEGQDKRVRKCVKICPAAGTGALTKAERKMRARQIIADSGANSEPRFKEIQASNLSTTFRQQAEWWLQHMQNRKRKPIKPKTAATWRDCLRNWLIPNIGDVPLADVNNLTVKGLVSKMAAAGLKPKSIQSYIQVVKMVVASCVDEEGEQRFHRKWNHDFIDLPLVTEQNTPTFNGREVCRLIADSQGLPRALFMLLAGTGLRIGEALGLPIEAIAKDRKSIKIRQSVWNGRVQSPKTPSAVRIVDICPLLAGELGTFIGGRKSGSYSPRGPAGRCRSTTS